MLNISQVVICTAQFFFQRFYRDSKNRMMKLDKLKFSPFHIAMTCMYLSIKVAEKSKIQHRDVLNVFYKLSSVNESNKRFLDVQSKRYKYWKKRLERYELLVLRKLGYHLRIIHPHQFILQFINVLDCHKIAQKGQSQMYF